MKKIIHQSSFFKGISIFCVAVILLSGCNSGSSGTMANDTSSSMMMPADTAMKDTMQPIDSSASTRPDQGKTH